MALQTTFGGAFQWPKPAGAGFSSHGFMTLDADGEKAAFILEAPKAGNLQKVSFATDTFVQCTNGLKVSFQDLTSGTSWWEPDGTADAYRTVTVAASDTVYTTGIMSDDGTDSGALKAVSRGDKFAVVIEFDTFAAGDDVDIKASQWPNDDATASRGFPHALFHNATSWGDPGQNEYLLPIAVHYDDGSIPFMPGCIGGSGEYTAAASITTGTGQTYDEVGVKFTMPFAATTVGGFAAAYLSPDPGSKFHLYDASDGTLLASSQYFEQKHWVASGNRRLDFMWDSDVELTAGATYRFTVRAYAFVAGSIYAMAVQDGYSDAGHMWPDASNRCYRDNGGTWTDDSTSTWDDTDTQWSQGGYPLMGLWLGQADDAAQTGGGAGNVIITRRGIR